MILDFLKSFLFLNFPPPIPQNSFSIRLFRFRFRVSVFSGDLDFERWVYVLYMCVYARGRVREVRG